MRVVNRKLGFVLLVREVGHIEVNVEITVSEHNEWSHHVVCDAARLMLYRPAVNAVPAASSLATSSRHSLWASRDIYFGEQSACIP